MSALAKLAKEIGERRNIGQTTAECQLMVWPFQAEMSSDRGEWSRRHRGSYLVHTEMSEKGEVLIRGGKT